MSVYVDPIREVRYGRWKYACHMIADTLDELHAMAEAIGMHREWFQSESFPHYDLLRPRRAAAVKLGAIELNRRPFIYKLREVRTRWYTEGDAGQSPREGNTAAAESGIHDTPGQRLR